MDLDSDCTKKDVLCDILRRLPVKSLVRFMCVSKPWSDLISGSSFVNYHIQFNKLPGLTRYFEYFKLANSDNLHQKLEHVKIPCPWRPDPLLPKPRPEKPKMVDGKVKRKEKPGGFSIQGHHNGLICACDIERYSVFTKSCDGQKGTMDIVDVEKLIIFNPITRRFKILPDSHIDIPELPMNEGDSIPNYNRYLLYKRLQVVGFGFVDEVAYKVVRVTYGMGGHDEFDDHFRQFQPPWVEVYDSRSDSWRRVHVDHNVSCTHISDNINNFLDGSLHWLGFVYEKLYCTTLVSFNLVEEKFSEVLLTGWSDDDHEDDYFSEYDDCNGLAILGESVALFVGDRRNKYLLRIWKMDSKEGEVSWTKMYRFNFRIYWPLGFCRDGELLCSAVYLQKLFLYDPKNMEDGCKVDFLDLGIKMGNVVTDFVESLLLLDGVTGNTEEEMDSVAEETPNPSEETAEEEEEEALEAFKFLFDSN